tara:strand:- start:1029 stop:1970 length:942 start_codon:yes stop_codon:yes gene_type:complete
MYMRVLALMLSLLLFAPVIGAQSGGESWRENEVDVSQWDDGPVLEGSPMDFPISGNPVVLIEVDYQPGHLQSRVQGEIVIELFEQWAPNTTANMIMHVELTIYDGIFFHRVIDDFVTQSGDPTCKTVGVYPITNAECGGGGDGHTLDLEHHENLSHVDGAIGMARSQDPNSADTQWYIAETEAHNLDPENRDDEGYATFGIVRNGMSHVRAIAEVPTTDDPSGTDIQNPASSAGRPLYEAKIISVTMAGVVPYAEEEPVVSESGFSEAMLAVGSVLLLGLIVAGVLYYLKNQPDIIEVENIEQELHDAELLDD